ncbi:MAG TPA: hypothetical protein VHB97_11560, partial [Polyangia bacterium]|nr:hypothetical protein [Polyangia bacterium]
MLDASEITFVQTFGNSAGTRSLSLLFGYGDFSIGREWCGVRNSDDCNKEERHCTRRANERNMIVSDCREHTDRRCWVLAAQSRRAQRS